MELSDAKNGDDCPRSLPGIFFVIFFPPGRRGQADFRFF
jgi:hypothetical protein